MVTMTRTLLVLALAASLFGCKKKDAATGDPAANKAAGDKAAAPAALTFKKLGSLPLEAEVPADANIDDSTKGAGFPSVTIYASPTTFVFGEGDMSDLKPTLEETKAQLAKDPNKLKSFTREEQIADGWILELTRGALAEPGRELFGVSVRRKLAGTAWDCGTNGASKEEQARARALCLSLRAAR